MFKKIIPASKAENEVELQQVAFKHGFTPRIYEVIKEPKYWTVLMEDLGEENTLEQIYGDDARNIPDYIWEQIVHILRTLLEEEGIEYVDITPYNFIEKFGKVYVIDFGDAKYTDENIPVNEFLQEFLDSEGYTWNPDFK
jgi:tRNA A-37 threonylcarbamoyl transferase component Bud32